MLPTIHMAATASEATHLVVDTEVFTAKACGVLLVPLDLALSNLWALQMVEAYPAVLAEQDWVQVAQAPAPGAALHPVHRKLYVH